MQKQWVKKSGTNKSEIQTQVEINLSEGLLKVSPFKDKSKKPISLGQPFRIPEAR